MDVWAMFFIILIGLIILKALKIMSRMVFKIASVVMAALFVYRLMMFI